MSDLKYIDASRKTGLSTVHHPTKTDVNSGRFLVAVLENRISGLGDRIGGFVVFEIRKNVAEITGISNMTKQSGVGARLLEAVEDLFREEGVDKVMAKPTSTSMLWWSKMGFTPTRQATALDLQYWVKRLHERKKSY